MGVNDGSQVGHAGTDGLLQDWEDPGNVNFLSHRHKAVFMSKEAT